MKYNIYWSDMHSNIHHDQLDQLPQWFEHVKETIDFWPIAYYPYFNQPYRDNFTLESIYPKAVIDQDWEVIRDFTNKVNQTGYPMFMGYEWQGSGEDGDHNVFFHANEQMMVFPLRYQELYAYYKETAAIAIPHHPAYQLGYRGKNWQTQIDAFSPFVEIYSSHGCSENDQIALTMNHHVHMGPRTSKTCGQRGYDYGHRYGLIASGDNHIVPVVASHGLMACLATSNSKADLWDALINRRVYGVSNERIQLDFTIDDQPMGSMIKGHQTSQLKLDIIGSNALDRVELIADNHVIEIISPVPYIKPKNKIRFKFKLEFGWGPNRKFFPEFQTKDWDGQLLTNGQILSIEKCFNSFSQKVISQDLKQCTFHLVTHKSAADGGWMGIDGITTEGLIFEIETDLHDQLTLIVNDQKYTLEVEELLQDSCIYPLMDEVTQLLVQKYQLTEYYRKDAWWHNSYKFKTSQAALAEEYSLSISKKIDLTDYHQIRVRVWQKNGSVAWSSPIFMEEQN